MAPKRGTPSLEQTVGRRQQPHRAAKEARGGRGTGLGRTAGPTTTTTTRGMAAAATPAPGRATAARGQPSGQTPAALAPSSKKVAKRGRRAATAVQSEARRTRARAQAEGVVLRWAPGVMTAVYEERRPHDNGSDRVAVATEGGQMEVDPVEDDNGGQMEVDREEETRQDQEEDDQEEEGGEHEETAAGVEASSPAANDAAAANATATAATIDAAATVEASRADAAAVAASSAAQQHTAGKAPSAARRSRDSRWSPYPAGREGRSSARERISERSARPAGTSEQEEQQEEEGTRDTTTGMGTGEGEDMEGAELPSVSTASDNDNDNDESSALAAQPSVPEQHQHQDDEEDDGAAINASSVESSSESSSQQQRRSKRKRAVSDDEDDDEEEEEAGVEDREAEGSGGSRRQPQQQNQEGGGRHRSIKRAKTHDGSSRSVGADLAGAVEAVSSKRSVAAGTSRGGAPLLGRSGSRSLSPRSRSSSPAVMTTTTWTIPAPQRLVPVTPPPLTSARDQNGVPDAEELALRAQNHGPAFDAGAIKYAAMVYPSGIPVCWGRGDDAPAEYRIGGGGQADIYEVRHRDDVDGPSYALKVYRATDKATGAAIPAAELLANYEAERNAMKRARHDNIVTLYDSFMDDKRRPTRLCLLMEMMDGDVASLCRRSGVGHGARDLGGMADRSHVQAMFVDVLAALAHMHAQGLAHLDVHPSNILYKDVLVDSGDVFGGEGDDEDDFRVQKRRRTYKLSDLGFAKDVGDPQMLGGHAFYMAPEVDLQNPRLAHAFPGWLRVTPASDIWALFCTLWAAWDPEFEAPKRLTRRWRVEGMRSGDDGGGGALLRLRKWPYDKVGVALAADLAIRHAYRRQIRPLKPFADMVEWEPRERPSAVRLLAEMRSGRRPSLGDTGRPGGVQAPKEDDVGLLGQVEDEDGDGRLDFLYMTPWRKNRRIRRMTLGEGESVSRDTALWDSAGDHRGAFLAFDEDELHR